MGVSEIAETEGIAASITLSSISVSSQRSMVESVEVSTSAH